MTGNQVEETETNDDDIQVMREGGNRENISISASTSSSSGFEDDHPIRSSSPLPPILTPQVSPRRDRVPRYFYRKVGPTPKTFGKVRGAILTYPIRQINLSGTTNSSYNI